MADNRDRPPEFFISAGEATEGPYDVQTLRARIAAGLINSRYQVWDEGAQNWLPFSVLDPLLRPPPAAPEQAPGGRKTPVRVVRPPPVPLPGQPPIEGVIVPPKAPGFEASGSRSSPLAGAPLKGIIPRHTPTQKPAGGWTFEETDGEEETDESDEPAPAKNQAEAPSAPRRRNYSPQTAGATAARPFTPAAPHADAKPFVPATPAPAVESSAPVIEAPPRPVWPVFAVCGGVCLLALVILWLGGIVNFGYRVREENIRLTGELGATRQKVADRDAQIKLLLSEKQEYLDRFTAAQEVVRRMRISVFASTRRAIAAGDRTEVDQRLFELEQLARLVPDDDSEAKIHRELTDQYFAGEHPAPTPAPLPKPEMR